ncbi:MAG: fibronectin type III domain-containing protein [Vicingaceae bacterium]
MKKISTLSKLFLVSIILSFNAFNATSQVLLNEDFSSGLLPVNWTTSSVSAGDLWEYGGSVDFGSTSTINDPFGNSGEYAHIDFSDDPDTTSLITPIVDISTLTNPRLTFYYISQTTSTSFSPYNRLIVDYWDGAAWINITVIDTLTTVGWTEYDFNISTYTFGTDSVQFRFSAQEGGAAIGGTGTATFDQDLALDDVTIEETPTCLVPTSISASSIVDTSLSLSWTENNSATQWEIQYGTTGFTLGTGTDSLVNSNPKTIVGLTPDTEYDFYVRSICLVGDTSAWSIAGTFKTAFACPAGAVCATYTAGDIDTDRAFTSLPGTSTCPETLSVTIPAGNRIDSVSTRYTMTAIGSAWMSEQRSWLYSTNTLAGEASLSTGSGTTTGTFSYDRGGLTFANGATGVATFEFHAGRTFGGSGCDATYNYVDNGTWIIIAYNSLAPACLEPINSFVTDITSDSVQLNWAGTGTATEWIVEWDTAGYTAGTSANSLVVLTDTFAVITGLDGLTTYDFYVRSICGPSDTSNYTTVESFTTLCDPFVAPFSEDFNALTLPSCWEQGAGNSEDWEFQLTDGHIGNTGNQGTGSTTSGGGLASVDDSSPHNTNTSLVSPFIDVSGLTSPRLNFFTISDNEGNVNGNVDFHVDVYDGANWNDSIFFSDTNTLNGTWEQIFVDLSSLTITGPIQVRFVVDENNGTLFDDDRAIDDVVVEETPSCPSPTALGFNNITDSSVVVSWTNGGTETEWEIEI